MNTSKIKEKHVCCCIYNGINARLKKNVKTDMWYIGQANNVASRLSQHFTQLMANKHRCQPLQNDWATYEHQAFSFFIVEQGSHLDDSIIRLKKERKTIANRRNKCYNTVVTTLFKQTKKNSQLQPNCIPVRIEGVSFLSISEAARFYNVSLSTMRHRLNDPEYTS